MAKLKLRLDNKKEVTNLAYAMIAKDGEVVDFDRDVHCENQVEVWLNRLMDIMRSTIRYVKKIRIIQQLIIFCALTTRSALLNSNNNWTTNGRQPSQRPRPCPARST